MTDAQRRKLREFAEGPLPLRRAIASALRRIDDLEKALAEQIGQCAGCEGSGFAVDRETYPEWKGPCFRCSRARNVLDR